MRYYVLLLVVFNVTLNDCHNIDTHFPIIYEDPQLKTHDRSTYFGYTVITHSANNQSWIQVGAPRAVNFLYPEVHEPGLIYRCPIAKHCKPYQVDVLGNQKPGLNFNYVDKKDYGWLGGSMTLHKLSDLFIVCAHRWMNQIDSNDKMQGVCYSAIASDGEDPSIFNSVHKIVPLLGNDLYKYGDGWIYRNQLGQAGFSSFFYDDKREGSVKLILGAPGVHQWAGNTILLEADQDRFDIKTWNGALNQLQSPQTNIKNREWFEYFGYSVATGKFFSTAERLFVAGSPRANFLKGKVTIYQYQSVHGGDVTFVQIIYGKSVGGYFGANLQVGDLNNDGLDDLLVAATMLPTPTVFIYMGNRKGSFEQPSPKFILQSNPAWGRNTRFGSAIVVFDMDLDGHKEVLIGAPHAEDNAGIIAIWKGSENGPNGLSAPYVILKSSDFSPNIRGFGSSISFPDDLDNNIYPDIAIGSYLSGHVLLLRGRPVIKLRLDFNRDKNKIKLQYNTKTFMLALCVESNPMVDINHDYQVTIRREVTLDSRIYFVDNKQPNFKNSEKKDLIKITRGSQCEDFKISTRDELTNYIEPIVVSASVTILDYTVGTQIIYVSNTSTSGVDTFNKWYPVAEKAEERFFIPFVTGCGDDNVCQSDLSVRISSTNNTKKFILGSSNIIQLSITVKNIGEPAYLTQIKLNLPYGTTLARQPSNCEVPNDLEVLCTIANILHSKTSKNVTLDIDMRSVSENASINSGDQLEFMVKSISESEEIKPIDNIEQFVLTLSVDASIKVEGETSENVFFYKSDKSENPYEYVRFGHLFKVQKYGISPANNVSFSVLLPYIYENQNKFIDVYQPQGYQNGQPIYCYAEGIPFVSMDDDENFFEATKKRTKRSNEESQENKIKQTNKRFTVQNSSAYINDERKFPSNRTARFACYDGSIQCERITCNIGAFIGSQSYATLLFTMRLNISSIREFAPFEDIFVYTSEGKATIMKSTVSNDGDTSMSHVTSVLVSLPTETKVGFWLIVVSIVLGLLLLALIIFGLTKMGFFERNKKKELNILRRTSQMRKSVMERTEITDDDMNQDIISNEETSVGV